MPSHEELWNKTLADMELTVSRANFATWFKDTGIIDHNEGVITIAVPNAFAKEWLENKYNKFILKSLRSVSPEIRAINYYIRPASESRSTLNKIKISKDHILPQEEQMEFKDFHIDPVSNLNPKYTLDTF